MRTIVAAIALSLSTLALAEQSPEAQYAAAIATAEKEGSVFFKNPLCEPYLSKDWGSFSGPNEQYAELEKKYLEGASLSSSCLIQRANVYRVWLELFEAIHQSAQFANKPLSAQFKETQRRMGKVKVKEFDDYLHKIFCHATTPVIYPAGSRFSQKVNVSCAIPEGQAKVDLVTKRVTMGNIDIINGKPGVYFGKSFESIYYGQ